MRAATEDRWRAPREGMGGERSDVQGVLSEGPDQLADADVVEVEAGSSGGGQAGQDGGSTVANPGRSRARFFALRP